jgi:quercetin dioxygenase-like cupin family protein
MYELVLQPHQPGAAFHYHKYIHETFVVIKGQLLMQWKEEHITLTAGSMLHVPPGIHHGFSNESGEESRLLLIFNPASAREEFFRRLYKNLAGITHDEQLYEAGEKYDTWYSD